MEKKSVIYQGERMIQGWPKKIQKAQKHPSVLIHGKEFERIRYGSEKDDWGANEHGCHDCRVIKAQVHVWDCNGEKCPNCGGQLISCDCEPKEL
jgi:hypothetical protein